MRPRSSARWRSWWLRRRLRHVRHRASTPATRCLEYEHALTRIDSRTNTPYNTSARHGLDQGAHPSAGRGARGVPALPKPDQKLGPSTAVDAVAANASTPPGPGGSAIVANGCRAGARRPAPIIEAIEDTGRKVAWVCDPMHGNTFETSLGYKTRAFDQVADD